MHKAFCNACLCLPHGRLHRRAASPQGTRYEIVEEFVRKEGWQPSSLSGFHVPFERGHKDNAGNAPTGEVRQTMRVYLGHYSGLLPFYMHEVYGYWLFDANNRLFEVCVIKNITDL